MSSAWCHLHDFICMSSMPTQHVLTASICSCNGRSALHLPVQQWPYSLCYTHAGSWPALSHCSYHQHSERFILAVTAGPPQKEILVWDRWSGHIHTVGLYSPQKDRMAFLHNDMHPAWSADASTLAFDSTHTGQGWQVCHYVHHHDNSNHHQYTTIMSITIYLLVTLRIIATVKLVTRRIILNMTVFDAISIVVIVIIILILL